MTANANAAFGALLYNNGGADTGAISVSSSTFNNNTAGDGLDATSNGAITLNKVTASFNDTDGSHLINNGSGTGAISVSSSTFNGNATGPGLAADSTGVITLNKVTANTNGGEGAFLENDFSGTSAISVSSSTFNSNTASDGLDAFSNGNVTVNKVTATGNFFSGVDAAGNNIVVSCSNLSNNHIYGIAATLSGGTLTLNKVTLIGNTSGPYSYSGGTLVTNPHC